MPLELSNPVIAIVGPTASGKSDVAQLVAQSEGGAVVSADSMQIYRGMDIGTGKVLPGERLVQHYGIDLVDPGEPYSAALFQEYARSCFAMLDDLGEVSVLCGGTGFYVRAAIDEYDFPRGEQVGNKLRDELNAFARDRGAHALWARLRDVDPASASIIPENDVKRVVRAFELIEEGTTYASQKERLASIPQVVPCLLFGLAVDPDILRKRIDARVDRMVENGLVQEVEGLLEAGFRRGVTAPQAIGYKEIVSYLDGERSLDDAVSCIKTATHRYAKRQRTWFRKDKRIAWIDADDFDADAIAGRVVDLARKPSAAGYELREMPGKACKIAYAV